MFKGFGNKSRAFNGFPNLNFQVNNEAYGFSGCTFWLDAAYGLNTNTDLAAVSSWQSRIGGITFTQATAGNQPRYIASNANFNNYPTVESNDGATTAKFMNGPIRIATGSTFVFIAKYNAINSINAAFGTTGSNEISIGLGGTFSGLNGPYVMFNAASPYSATTESTNSKIVIITPSGIWVNGSKEYSGTTLINQTSVIQILGNFSSTTQNLNGHLAEAIIYNTDYSNSATSLSANINSKYAIY